MQIGNTKDKERIEGWWNDQYLHPHETTHTVGEVLRWFKKSSIVYYQTLPSSAPFEYSDLEVTGVWNKTMYPYFPIRMYKQLTWMWKTHSEGEKTYFGGGYWLTFGRKK